MKTRFTLLTIIITALSLTAFGQAWQIPNGTFQDWPTTSLAPTGWSDYETAFGLGELGHPDSLVTRDANVFTVGTTAAKLVSDSAYGADSLGVVAAVLSLGPASAPGGAPYFGSIPFTYEPDTLSFFYQYSSLHTDSGFMQLTIYAGDSVLTVYSILPPTPGSAWGEGIAVLTHYYITHHPDSISLQFASSKTPTHTILGSTLIIDNVRFGYVNQPLAINEVQPLPGSTLYPNPAKDQVTISASKNLAGYTAEVYGLTGQLVLSRIIDNAQAVLNVASLSNGMYVYRITDQQHNAVLQDKFVITR